MKKKILALIILLVVNITPVMADCIPNTPGCNSGQTTSNEDTTTKDFATIPVYTSTAKDIADGRNVAKPKSDKAAYVPNYTVDTDYCAKIVAEPAINCYNQGTDAYKSNTNSTCLLQQADQYTNKKNCGQEGYETYYSNDDRKKDLQDQIDKQQGLADAPDPEGWAINASGKVSCGDIADLYAIASGYFGMLVAITIISLTAFTMLDFAKGVFSSDPEPQFKKAFKNFMTRVIIIIILLVLPEILQILTNLTLEGAETCVTSFN